MPTLTSDQVDSFYDTRAWLYDLIVGSRLYHRFVWGMSPKEHAQFAQFALDQATSGAVLDAGCGSLLFTAGCYRKSSRPLTLFDGSAAMLARARRRMGPGAEGALWVQGDLYKLPFQRAQFGTILHFGVLHCLDDAPRALAGFHHVLEPEGRLFLSCLVLGRSRGDAFLKRLHARGHIAGPRSVEEVQGLVIDAGFRMMNSWCRGSFLFIEAERIETP